MIVCKFNQTEPPDTIFSSGFDSFFEQILESGNDDVKISIKARIEEILGERVTALEQSMPHLRVLLGRRVSRDLGEGDSKAMKLRWRFLLSNLIAAISSKHHPIALLFEDLQWADEDTLDTIQLIIMDSKIRYCLYCMSHRETNGQSKLTEMTKGLLDMHVLVWNIKLGSIEKESVDFLVSETLV